MPIYFLLFLSLFLYPISQAESQKNLPSDIRLEKGSELMLQQFVDKQPNADATFPIVLTMTCDPRLKASKLNGYKCKLSDLKYAEKAK